MTYLSSASFVNKGSHAKLAINDQTGVTNKSIVYQLGGWNNQDVTSLQSIPKRKIQSTKLPASKSSVIIDSLSTQLVKSDEKLGKALAVTGQMGGIVFATESYSKTSQLNFALNKTTNVMAVV